MITRAISAPTPPLVRRDFSRLLGVLVLVGVTLLCALSLPDNSATRLFTWPWYFYVQCLYLLPILGLVLWELSGSRINRGGRLWDTGLLLMSGGAMVSGLTSLHRENSLPLVAPYLFSISLVYAVVTWLQPNPKPNERRLYYLAILLGSVLSLVIISSLLSWFLNDVTLDRLRLGLLREGTVRNGHPFGHSTYTAGFAILALPWLIALGWIHRGVSRIFWTTNALLALAIVPTTSSRGGAIGVVVLLVIFSALAWNQVQMTTKQGRSLAAFLIVCAISLISAEPRLRELALHGKWNVGAQESNRQRMAMQKAGFLMGLDRPLLGQGPGTIPLVYPLYRRSINGGTENILELHNTPIQLWAELGILGVGAVGLLSAGVILDGLKYITGNSTPPRENVSSVFSKASFCGLIAYGTFALTDFQLDIPIFGSIIACYIAVLIATKRKPQTPFFPRLSVSIAAITPIIFIGWAVKCEAKARAINSAAYDYLANGDEAQFINFSDKASQAAKWDFNYDNQVASFLIEKRKMTSDAITQKKLTEEIVRRLKLSLTKNAAQEYAESNLGWLLLPSNPVEASVHFEHAACLVPDKGGTYLGLGLTAIATGRTKRAVTALAIECINDPMFITSPWWRLRPLASLKPSVSIAIQHMYAEVVRQIPSNAPLRKELAYHCALSNWIMTSGSSSTVSTAASTDLQKTYFREHDGPSDFESSETVSYRRQRLGYPVVYRHPEMPPPIDEYEVQENAVAAGRLRYLFPSKGWLPTPLLSRLLDALNQ